MRLTPDPQLPRARSYVRFVGRTASTTVLLEGKNRYSFSIDVDRDANGMRYGVVPGSYQVTVRRGDAVVLNRVLFIVDGETRDIPIR